MSKITILNQEIHVQGVDELQDEQLLRSMKSQFVKKILLTALYQFIKSADIPQELKGYILHMESEIKNTNIIQYTDYELLTWLDRQIKLLQQRERLYVNWHRHQTNKLSNILIRIKNKIFCIEHEASNEIESMMLEAKKELKAQIEKELITQCLLKTMVVYYTHCYWPISNERKVQQHELLEQIKQAADARSALIILQKGIMHIEQQYVANSLPAQLPFFQSKSRLVCYLYQASREISLKLKINNKKSVVEEQVEWAILQYLNDDVFYHNYKRRVIAQQLLMQLREDQHGFDDSQDIQKKYKMRTTLDAFIQIIDKQFKDTHFFTRFYKTKRSRLAKNLDLIKKSLIANNALSALELENDIKQPILQTLQSIIPKTIDADMQSDINSLNQVIAQALTPHAIEAILEGHIRSYLHKASNIDLLTCFTNFLTGQDNMYFMLAVKLENALLEWQATGILPAASGYKTFLQTLGEDRENNENDIQRLERQYHIKIPRSAQAMRKQNSTMMQQAYTLLQRIKSVS